MDPLRFIRYQERLIVALTKELGQTENKYSKKYLAHLKRLEAEIEIQTDLKNMYKINIYILIGLIGCIFICL
jgi:hypothetical protein